MAIFELFFERSIKMELQTIKMGEEKTIPSGANLDGISIRRLGIAKILWQKLDVEILASEIIPNGVNIYKG